MGLTSTNLVCGNHAQHVLHHDNVYIPATADLYGSGLTGVSQPSIANR